MNRTTLISLCLLGLVVGWLTAAKAEPVYGCETVTYMVGNRYMTCMVCNWPSGRTVNCM
jgi:hypothetical protein